MRPLVVLAAAVACFAVAAPLSAGETVEISADAAGAVERTATSRDLALVLPARFFVPKGATEFTTPYIAQLLYTVDNGKTWTEYRFYKELDKPIDFTAEKEGRYGFYVVLFDREGRHYGMPDPGDAPQVSVLFDWTPPQVSLVSPTGGEIVGSAPFDIKWTAADDFLVEKPVSIDYSLDAGKTWCSIAQSTDNTGSFAWSVPAGFDGRALVRVTASDEVGHAVSAVSASPVLIDTTAPKAALAGPTLAATGEVRLDVTADDGAGSGIAEIALWSTVDSGATWSPAGSAPAGQPLIFRSTSGTYGLIATASDKAGNASPKPAPGDAPQISLAIETAKPTVRLKTLSSGGTVAGGAAVPIEWEAVAPKAAERGISIFLSQDGGNSWSVVANDIVNTGTFLWEVPKTNCSNCVLKVTLKDADGVTGSAQSAKTFIIDSTRPRSAIGISSAAAAQPLGDLSSVMKPVAPSARQSRPAAGAPIVEASAGPTAESTAPAVASGPQPPPLPEGAMYIPETTQPPSAEWAGPKAEPFAGAPGPDAGYDDIMAAADVAYRENNLPIARDLFKRAADVAPDKAAPHAALGRIYAREGDFSYTSRKEAFEAALYEFEKAIALGGDDADVCNDMGFVLLQTGRTEDARAAFVKAAQSGGRAIHWYNLGQALYRLQDFDGAAEAFLKTLELEPGRKEASFLMGRISAARGSWQDAKTYWTQAVDGYGPDSEMGKIALGGIQQARERLGEVAPEPVDRSLRQKLDRVR